MKLTPLDIRHKEFKRGMRGYADTEVDEFLDEVADEFERLFKENIDVSERLEALEEKIAHYRMIEDTLQKTLLSAQQSAEELKQNATKESQLILRDAELKARQIINESYADKQRIEKEVAVLKNAEDEFRFRFRNTLEGYLKQVGDFEKGGTQQRVSEFQRQADALKEAIAREDTIAAPPAAAPSAPKAAAPPAPADTSAPAAAAPPVQEAPPTKIADERRPESSMSLRELLRQAQAAVVHERREPETTAEPDLPAAPANAEAPAEAEEAVAPPPSHEEAAEAAVVGEPAAVEASGDEKAEGGEEATAQEPPAAEPAAPVQETLDVPPDLAPPANTGVSRRVPVEWRVSGDEPAEAGDETASQKAGGTDDLSAGADTEVEEDDFKW
jgi:cell division initiation protein